MEYNMDTLNGIYKAYNDNLGGSYYIVFFKNGISANYIYHPYAGPRTYGPLSNFPKSWGKYVDAEPHEIASLEASMKANYLVIVEKESSHIPLMF